MKKNLALILALLMTVSLPVHPQRVPQFHRKHPAFRIPIYFEGWGILPDGLRQQLLHAFLGGCHH